MATDTAWWHEHGLALASLLAFVAYAVAALLYPGSAPASFLLALLLGVIALWFVYCVTGDAEAKRYNLFTFAYSFTFGAFALLLMPVLNDQLSRADMTTALPQSEGGLRLIRGCVQPHAAGSPTLGERLAPCPAAASAAALPDGIMETGYRYAWLVSVGGVTARTLAVSNCAFNSSEVARLEGPAQAAAVAASAPGAAASAVEALRTAADALKRAKEQAAASCRAQGTEDPKRPFVEVSGGVAVPLFVVVLALIGGAVSISRRIPEFQRRNDPNYLPTPEEPAMPAFRVRESVVFQIMQLVSAPFLAIATLQVIEPNSLASASTLAFATGFFSETILYMIRGMVNGLKPELTKVPTAALVNLSGRLVLEGDDGTMDWKDTRVEIRPRGTGTWSSVPVANEGRFSFEGIAPGHFQLVVLSSRVAADAPREIDVDGKPLAPVDIAVKAA